jgi:hypothetical protein
MRKKEKKEEPEKREEKKKGTCHIANNSIHTQLCWAGRFLSPQGHMCHPVGCCYMN